MGTVIKTAYFPGRAILSTAPDIYRLAREAVVVEFGAGLWAG
jgi:hypothetical protein